VAARPPCCRGELLRRAAAATLIATSIAVALAAAVGLRDRGDGARCGKGFTAEGARCLARRLAGASCSPPLTWTDHGCDAPDVRVLVPACTIFIGSADWEAEGRVVPRLVHVGAFRLAAFEATRGALGLKGDAARAVTGISRDDAAGFCADRGGRLPTENEWIAAATSGTSPPRRYPWGDTGAVCRRAAWGLLSGPCARGADGPDTVGAHPDGDSPLGLHDLSGNAAEWVAAEGSDERSGPAAEGAMDPGPPRTAAMVGAAKGGSWQSSLATELRVWARIELDPSAHDPRVGVRCAYPP